MGDPRVEPGSPEWAADELAFDRCPGYINSEHNKITVNGNESQISLKINQREVFMMGMLRVMFQGLISRSLRIALMALLRPAEADRGLLRHLWRQDLLDCSGETVQGSCEVRRRPCYENN